MFILPKHVSRPYHRIFHKRSRSQSNAFVFTACYVTHGQILTKLGTIVIYTAATDTFLVFIIYVRSLGIQVQILQSF